MRTGILGGSFDPIHHGHLILAEDAANQLQLDRVIFMVAGDAPLREAPYAAAKEDRIVMVRQAVQTHALFEVSSLECERPGPSYSIDTILELSKQHPDDSFWWILGEDQLSRLENWHRVDALVERIRFACLSRHTTIENAAPVRGARVDHLRPRRVDISATEIRAAMQKGESVSALLPEKVHAYIQQKNLYAGC